VSLGESVLKVVASDSGAAILNEQFDPLWVVAATAVLVEPPYRATSLFRVEPIFSKVDEGPLLIVHELELCQSLLKETKADVVHLDMSLGGVSVEELSLVGLSKMKISGKARGQLLKILPKIRKIALDIKRVYGVEVLAIGKESVPVRIAELTCGAHAILYTAQKAVKEESRLKLGLPAKCSARILENGVAIQSLASAEHDLMSYAKDDKHVLKKVETVEILNPCARGFRALEIIPIG